MLPFLASSVHVVKKDGSTVDINSDGSPDSSDGDHAPAPGQPVVVVKHHHSDSDGFDGTVVPVVAIVFVFLWLIIKSLMAPFTQRAARRGQGPVGGNVGLSDEEQAVLLKLQRTLTDMEGRIESLETILIDEHRTKEKYGNKI